VTFPCGRSIPALPRTQVRLLLACLLAVACGGEEASHRPQVEVAGLEGVETALRARRGKGVLLNFWALWCEPCVEELPDLAEVSREFEDQGGVVFTVNYDLMLPGKEAAPTLADVRSFLGKEGLAFAAVVYDAPDFDAINERFGLPGPIPVTLALDREGNVVDRQEGRADRARFSEMMRRALAR
jgi:thiol-disulfide isomerase/thioredoxin